MKKCLNVMLIILFLMFNFMPFYKVEAASSYTVEMVANQGSNEVIGTYSSYSAALSVMNAQNSTSTSVATIYKDGVPVDSKYAIFKFKPGGTYYLYTSATSSSAYTSVAGSYGTDAAVLGYSDNGRVKIMISGFIGWTSIDNGVVTPISLLSVSGNTINVPGGLGIRIRKAPSLSGTIITTVSTTTNFTYTETTVADGYTWYKITYNGSEAWIAKTDSVTVLTGSNDLGTYYLRNASSGNLLHYFTYYNGSGYGSTYTNLGTAPTYLTAGVRYYSFDGNYFYSSLTTMLEDYRNGVYTNSVNYDSPHYAYYLYLTSRSVTGYTAEDFDNIIISMGYTASTSKMYGTGAYFKEAEETYGQNALMMFGTAMNESANGTSNIAMNKNNLFGYGAADSCAYECAYSYDSVRDSIMDYASKTGNSYSLVTGSYYYGAHYGNKASGRNVKYATDPYWGEKQATNSFTNDQNYGGKDFNSSTIGAVKKGITSPWVFDSPAQTSSGHIYTLKNTNSSDIVNDLAVNVVDKVVGANGVEFYKIYTDLPSSDNILYGYVTVSELNVTNNQPVITVSDQTIAKGSTFDPLSIVTATDEEDGDLTSEITYEGTVDTSTEGTYEITYTVVDNSNFHASKTVTIEVVAADLPEIDASDKEVKQFTEFDPMEGVSATASDGTDLTDSITYEGEVNTDEAGTYEVTYKVSDEEGNEVTKTVTITVVADEKPVIEADDQEIYLGSEFDPLEGVTATDEEDGDLTSEITYEGEVNPNVIGEYQITYKVSDKNGQETTKTVTIKVIVNQEPVINVYDKTIYLNSEFDPLDGVTATDEEDGTLTDIVVIENNVDTSELGEYTVTYSVTDSYGQTVTKTITVTVAERVLEEAEGWFHIEEISFSDDQMVISGYEIITGISNSPSDNISYKLILVDQDTDEEITFDLDRWLDDVPYVPNDGSSNDYSGSWFTGNIDLSEIADGDYTMYIKASSDEYYSLDVVSNVEYSDNLERKYEGSDGTGYAVRENKTLASIDLELFVRSEGLITYGTTPVWSGLYSDLFSYSLDGYTLNLVGTSYALKTDYKESDEIEREIVFEDKETHKVVYTQEIGSTADGVYSVTSNTNNDMTRVWFDADVDLSSLDEGTYVIYIRTKNGDVDDYSELADTAYSDLTETTEIDGKTISLKRVNDRRIRLELVIE